MKIRMTMSIVSMLLAGALFSACNQPAGQSTGNSNRVEKQEIVNQRTAVLDEAQKNAKPAPKNLKPWTSRIWPNNWQSNPTRERNLLIR